MVWPQGYQAHASFEAGFGGSRQQDRSSELSTSTEDGLWLL